MPQLTSGDLESLQMLIEDCENKWGDPHTLRHAKKVVDSLSAPPSGEVAALIRELREEGNAANKNQSADEDEWPLGFLSTHGDLCLRAADALASLSAPVPDKALREHTKAVGDFLRDLYSTMVDPCAEGTMTVAEMQAALMAAAIKQRELLAAPVPAREWIPTGRYRHYKGELYDLLTTARLEADDRTMAVYRSVETGNIWTRPLAEFRKKFTALPPPPAADK